MTMLAKDAEIHISDAEAGPYVPFGKILTAAKRDEATDADEVFVLGEDEPVSSEGEDEGTFDLTFLHSGTDAGQVIARTARKNKTAVFLRALLDGENGEQQRVSVRSINWTLDRNGTGANKYINGSATFTTTGPAVPVVATP